MHAFRRPSLTTFLAAFSFAATLPTLAQSAPAAPAPAAAPATAPADGSATAKTYKLNLSPPFKVGEKFSLSTNTTTDMDLLITATAPGMTAPQTQHQQLFGALTLEGDCEVLAVTTEGQPQKLAVTVKTLKALQNGQEIPGLPAAGDKIIAEKTGKNDKTLTVNGKPLNPELAKLIEDSFPVQSDGESDQIMFGPKGPVAVGATWSPNPAMLADLQTNLPSATGIDGKLKLDGVETSGDGQVAKISANLTVLGATAPLPPPLNTFPAECHVQLTGTFPSAAKGTFNQVHKTDMKFAGETDANVAHLKIDATATQTGNQTITIP
jgi:hypothetical protein